MSEIEKAKEIVEDFISAMNSWEKNAEIIDNNQENGLTWQQKAILIKEEVTSIIDKYCTEKQRKMSAPNSIRRGLEGTYVYDPAIEKVETVEREKNNRLLVYTTKQEEKEYFCYVLLKKDAQWIIDSKKRKFYGEEKWQNSYL